MSTSTYPIQVALLLAAFCHSALAADEDTGSDSETQLPKNCKYCPDNDGWSGWLEGGIGYQNNDDYRFGRYTGYVDEGAFVNANGELNYRDEDGLFIEGIIDNLGLESRRIQLQGGKQGSYEFGLDYDQIPNYRESSTLSPLFDSGNGQLELPAGWIPGATTNTMPTLSSDLVNTTLKSKRERTGANFSLYPNRKWELSAYARHEEKDGTRDIGATIGFSQSVILAAPLQYETDEFGMTLGYIDKKLQSQISYSASLFKNAQDSISWRNPYESAASNTAYGSMAEAPDNQFHQISAILGYQLRPDTRLSARFASGQMTQNQGFQPYTINPAVVTTALPASDLDGKVNTTLASIGINSRPMPRLLLDASYTFSDRDNKSSVNVYDYVVTDQGSAGLRKNRAYSFEQKLLRLKGAYRFQKNIKLSLGFDDDKVNRSYVQVEETQDQTAWTRLKFRPLDSLETTLKYAYSDRDASPYVPLSTIDPLLDNPNPNFYDNPLMRVLHMAERTRSSAGFELAYTPVAELSLGFDLDFVEDDYDNMYLGLQQASGLIYTASITYSFSETLAASSYYTRDKLDSDQKGSEKLLPSDADNLWFASDSYLTETIGLGITWMAIPEQLDIGLDLAYTDFTGTMDFAGASSLPVIGSTLTAMKLYGTHQLAENLSLRAEFRYEKYEENDWTKDSIVNTLPTLLALGTAPWNNSTSLGFVSLLYSF